MGSDLMNAPLDNTHAESAQAVSVIRAWIAQAHLRVLVWEPRPCPRKFK